MAAKTLSAFFAQNAKRIENTKYVASKRFIDPETKKPVEWEIQCITADENMKIRKRFFTQSPVPGRKGQFTQTFDANGYSAAIAVRCTVFPDLNDAELQNSYGVMGAEALISTMLSPGEFEDYAEAVLIANGFQEPDEIVEEAKN